MACVFRGRNFAFAMRTFIYTEYKDIFPELSGKELTNALILKALGEYGADTEGLHVIRDHRGKPFIGPRSRIKLSISVSHCGSTFAVVISDGNVGIDIQDERDNNYRKIAQRFFTEEECAIIDERGREAFYILWTRKEAYAKYTGGGIGQVMRKVQVPDREDVEFTDSMLEGGMHCCICCGRD